MMTKEEYLAIREICLEVITEELQKITKPAPATVAGAAVAQPGVAVQQSSAATGTAAAAATPVDHVVFPDEVVPDVKPSFVDDLLKDYK